MRLSGLLGIGSALALIVITVLMSGLTRGLWEFDPQALLGLGTRLYHT